MTVPTQESPPKNQSHRNKAIFITAMIFVVIGMACFIYWLVWARFHQYTDDAYVDGNNVITTPQVGGIVESFSTLNGDFVPQGMVLVELDKTDARISLGKAIADLRYAVRDVRQMFEKAKHYAAMIEVKKAEFIKAARDYEHRVNLIDEGGVSLENFEHAIATLEASFSDLIATEYQYTAAAALVENSTVETHPLVEQMKNEVRDAYVFLRRCTIRAPATGLIAQRTVQVGETVAAGQPLMAVVPLDQMWVTANYKEVQLAKMRIGQPVKVTSDIYGSRVVFHGKIAGIGGGTGSVFSVLPPQNATGNWIKIVQRVPVRITLDQEQIKQHPLRLGLSMETTVDIHDTTCPFVPEIRSQEPLFSTDVFATQEEGANALITQVINREGK
jgi:membrane fusion protein, multidrug efflux system